MNWVAGKPVRFFVVGQAGVWRLRRSWYAGLHGLREEGKSSGKRARQMV